MAELADAADSKSASKECRFDSCSGHQECVGCSLTIWDVIDTEVAQWIRAPAYEAGRRRFESCSRCQNFASQANLVKAPV